MAVFGLGSVGLNVIQGARMVGADRIIGIDINPAQEKLGQDFGLTDFINPNETENITEAIVDLTDNGDYSFECIGNVNIMRNA